MDDIAWYLYLGVVGAGVAAGFINTLAGSGSLVTLPVLIFLGLPATVANGTNRVGILMQNVVGGESFRRHGVLDLRGALLLSLPAILGSAVGAQIAVNLDEVMLRRTIGGLMIAMLVVILVRPERWLGSGASQATARLDFKNLAIFFAIGVYGGFIQAGVGIFLLAALVLGIGYDLLRANAAKVVINLIFTLSALVVFVWNDQVAWVLGIVLGVGNMLGAWVAARMAVERGAVWVRRLLIMVVGVSAAELLGLFSWILQLF